jgi:hypothetical protein
MWPSGVPWKTLEGPEDAGRPKSIGRKLKLFADVSRVEVDLWVTIGDCCGCKSVSFVLHAYPINHSISVTDLSPNRVATVDGIKQTL